MYRARQLRRSILVLLLTAVLMVDGASLMRHRTAGAPLAAVAQVAPAAPAQPAHGDPRRAALLASRTPPVTHRAVAHPSVRRIAVARPAATPTTRAAVAPAAPARPSAPAGPSSWGALNEAIAHIRSYRPGGAVWTVSSRYGHWGAVVLGSDQITIEPSVPAGYLYDVAVHEWSHVLSMSDYGNDVNAALAAMDGYYGGSGVAGAEDAADCMAILQGASWTHYTTCPSAAWRAGAERLLTGRRL